MDRIEIERKKIELLRVQAAKAEMALNIMMAEADIERLKKSIEVQNAREKELLDLIKQT